MILNLVKKSSAALLICTVFSSFSANAQISEINCAYDDSHRSVSISAKGGLNESLSIAVLPCGLTLDADLINSGAAIIRSMPKNFLCRLNGARGIIQSKPAEKSTAYS